MNNRRTLDERARVCVLQVHPRSLAAYNCVSIQKKQIKRVKGGDYYYYYYHYSRKVEAEKAAQPNSSAKINRVRGWKKRERERGAAKGFLARAVRRVTNRHNRTINRNLTTLYAKRYFHYAFAMR